MADEGEHAQIAEQPAPVGGAPAQPDPSWTGWLARASRNGAALFALGGAFIAAALPLAEFVRGVYELRVKEREHADSVELEFLKLLTSEKIVQADRRRVMQVLLVVSTDSPLRSWAATEAD